MSKKILLADDSLTIQKVISITLASEDYELEIVGDGNAAVAKAKAMKPDLILADVAMPGKNGYEVCEIIKKDPNLCKIPVLLLAGTFEPLNREEAARVKADDSIIKPFESTSFVDKVKSLLAKVEVATKEAEVTALPEAKPDLTGNVWGAGDFLGSVEEERAEAAAEPEMDMDFLGGDVFEEATKEAEEETPKQAMPDQAFMDIDLNAEPSKKAVAPPAPQRPVAPPAPPQRQVAPPPVVDFDAIQSEPFGTPQQEEDTTSYWTGEEAAVPPAAPQPPVPPPHRAPPPPVAPPAAPPQARREPAVQPPPAQAQPSSAEATPELLKLYQQKQAPAAAPVKVQVAPPAPAPRPVERVVERVAAAATERIADSSSLIPVITDALSREQIAEIVRKVAREVIEEIAWEVVPELTEEIVSNEMMKFRESFLKAKKKA